MIDSTAPLPTPLIAPSPYSIDFESATLKWYKDRLIDGGCNVSPSCRQSSLIMTSRSVLSMSALITAAVKAAG
jgi:hypothetical protein